MFCPFKLHNTRIITKHALPRYTYLYCSALVLVFVKRTIAYYWVFILLYHSINFLNSTDMKRRGGTMPSFNSQKREKKGESDRVDRLNANGTDLQMPALIKRQFLAKQSDLRFSDLGGCEAQFLETSYLMMHLKHPELYTQMGLAPPKGLLLHGPPGCGKSTFARALAGELELPIIGVSSTELVAGVSGESERKIRVLFAEAEQAAPVLLLIDDIDVIAAKRENAQKEMERRIVTQLIASIDELGAHKNHAHVFLIGTTNRPEVLDASLRRAGRFDKEIALGMPDQRARLEILKISTRRMRLSPNVNLAQLAQLTPGYVGADLQALVQEASTRAVSCAFNSILEERKNGSGAGAATASRPVKNPSWRSSIEEVREELNRTLNWLKSSDETSVKVEELKVSMTDFEWALSMVRPSAKREGFATVPDVTWADIGALAEVRAELQWSILYPIQRPDYFEALGIIVRPQGILLCGPPGCGKTLLAKAVAHESGMSFISIKGPELLNMYVGESERAVRTLFQRARDSAPCVIFFDEIDALCPKRSQKETTGSSRLVNQLLTEMDGLEERKQVYLIGATNRPDIVDPAILRPGRFDKVLFVDFPSPSDRADILRKCTKNGTCPRMHSSVNFEEIAKNDALEFSTGADLVALVHEATMIALKQRIEQKDSSIDSISIEHFESACKLVSPSVKKSDREHYKRLREIYAGKGLNNNMTKCTSINKVENKED